MSEVRWDINDSSIANFEKRPVLDEVRPIGICSGILGASYVWVMGAEGQCDFDFIQSHGHPNRKIAEFKFVNRVSRLSM